MSLVRSGCRQQPFQRDLKSQEFFRPQSEIDALRPIDLHLRSRVGVPRDYAHGIRSRRMAAIRDHDGLGNREGAADQVPETHGWRFYRRDRLQRPLDIEHSAAHRANPGGLAALHDRPARGIDQGRSDFASRVVGVSLPNKGSCAGNERSREAGSAPLMEAAGAKRSVPPRRTRCRSEDKVSRRRDIRLEVQAGCRPASAEVGDSMPVLRHGARRGVEGQLQVLARRNRRGQRTSVMGSHEVRRHFRVFKGRHRHERIVPGGIVDQRGGRTGRVCVFDLVHEPALPAFDDSDLPVERPVRIGIATVPVPQRGRELGRTGYLTVHGGSRPAQRGVSRSARADALDLPPGIDGSCDRDDIGRDRGRSDRAGRRARMDSQRAGVSGRRDHHSPEIDCRTLRGDCQRVARDRRIGAAAIAAGGPPREFRRHAQADVENVHAVGNRIVNRGDDSLR